MFVSRNEVVRSCPMLAVLWLCLGMMGLAVPRPAFAQGSPSWHVYESIPNLNGTTTVLWIKEGSTDGSGNYSGDTASIWTMDATGHQTSISPTYGPYPGWSVSEIDPTWDGTLLMAWTNDSNSDSGLMEELSLWKLDSVGNQLSVSPTYGPYPGWEFYELYQQPDGTASVFWRNPGSNDGSGNNETGDEISIWTVDSNGNQTAISPTYGRYPGWSFHGASPSLNKDGTAFLLWVNQEEDTNSGDLASIWKVDAVGNRTSISPSYGPYPGWYADEVVPAYDGTARMLWDYSDGPDSSDQPAVSLWQLDAVGNQTAISPTYGPYPGWYPEGLSPAPDNTSRLLWVNAGSTDSNGNYSGDEASLWSLDAAGNQISVSPTYGPYPGWSATFGLTVQPDGTERMTWGYLLPSDAQYSPSELSLWSLDSANTPTAIGPSYGPYD